MNTFPNPFGTDVSIDAAGFNWGYVKNGGPNGEAVEGITDEAVTYGVGGSANYMAFAAGPGFIFLNSSQPANKAETLFYSKGFAPFNYTEITSVAFSIRNSNITNDNTPWKLALRVDGNWLVSDADYRNSNPDTFETITVNPHFDTTWSLLTFEIGNSPLTVVGGATLPAMGQLQEVGMFLPGPFLADFAQGGQVRFNSIEVSAIPEPSVYALLFGLTALGFAYFKRRRASV